MEMVGNVSVRLSDNLVMMIPVMANPTRNGHVQLNSRLKNTSHGSNFLIFFFFSLSLSAFANTGVEFVVGLGNEFLSKIIDPGAVQAWVRTNVQPYLPATKITSITVGNEVLTFNNTSISGCLFPAMQSVHTALVNLGLDKQVIVTTAHSLAILETSYPPSAGAFWKDLKGCITHILDFHSKTGSPLLINAYPFFAYKGNPKQVSLDYVLFQSSQGIVDPASNLHYDNMLFAQIDAVYTAMAAFLASQLIWSCLRDR